jgi:hypothetical protein
MEHLDLCPYEEKYAADECPTCLAATKPCWTTPKGRAFHVRDDCVGLDHRREHPPARRTVLSAKSGGYRECNVCVNLVCSACGGNRHHACNPMASKLPHCSCAARNHR